MNPQQNWNQNGNYPNAQANAGFPGNQNPGCQPQWQAPWQNTQNWTPQNWSTQPWSNPNWNAQNWNNQNWNNQNWNGSAWSGFNPFMQMAQLMQQCAAMCAQIASNPGMFFAPQSPMTGPMPGQAQGQQAPTQGQWNTPQGAHHQNFNPQTNAPFPVPIDTTEKIPSKRGALSRDAA